MAAASRHLRKRHTTANPTQEHDFNRDDRFLFPWGLNDFARRTMMRRTVPLALRLALVDGGAAKATAAPASSRLISRAPGFSGIVQRVQHVRWYRPRHRATFYPVAERTSGGRKARDAAVSAAVLAGKSRQDAPQGACVVECPPLTRYSRCVVLVCRHRRARGHLPRLQRHGADQPSTAPHAHPALPRGRPGHSGVRVVPVVPNGSS